MVNYVVFHFPEMSYTVRKIAKQPKNYYCKKTDARKSSQNIIIRLLFSSHDPSFVVRRRPWLSLA